MNEHLINAFNVEIANKIGLEEAVILHQFIFWIERNKINNKNLHDGCYWTYNSFSCLSKLFPYMSSSTIKRKIKNLKDSGILIVKTLQNDQAGVSNWYSLDSVKLTQMLSKLNQGKDHSDTAYSNTVVTSSNTVVGDDPLETKTQQKQQYNSVAEFERVYAKYPRRIGRKRALVHFQASINTSQDLVDIEAALNDYKSYLTLNKTEEKYIQHAPTWFNNWRDWLGYYKQQPVKPKMGAGGRQL